MHVITNFTCPKVRRDFAVVFFQLFRSPSDAIVPGAWCTSRRYMLCLQGTLPESWGNTLLLTPHLNLQAFWCSNCSLQGTLPNWGSNTCDQSSLQSVDLSHNNIIGTVPMSWTALSLLADLNLGWNQLNGSVFGDPLVCNMTELLRMDVSYNALTGQLFGE